MHAYAGINYKRQCRCLNQGWIVQQVESIFGAWKDEFNFNHSKGKEIWKMGCTCTLTY
jgi:hypothetical protein